MKKRKRWTMLPENIVEQNHVLCNPGCGWYEIHSFWADKEVEEEQLLACIHKEDSLVLVRIHLGAYADGPLDESACEQIRRILSIFYRERKDVILRCTYDFEGKAMEQEPTSFSKVICHAEQIAGLLCECSAQLFMYQGVIVGNWGEMHSSRYVTKDCIKQLFTTLSEGSGAQVWCSLRKPVFWRNLVEETEAMSNVGQRKIAVFDDGIFGSATHLGTFGEMSREKAGWMQAWGREDELKFLHELGQWEPYGGEVIAGEEAVSWGLQKTVEQMKELCITYLNRRHDEKLLQHWENLSWSSDDCWNGMNGREYIGRHLGYRFHIQRIEDKRKLKIWITNTGFANLYEEAEVVLWHVEPSGMMRKKVLDVDMRLCYSGKDIVFKMDKPRQEGTYYISLYRKKDNRIIYLANPSDEEGRVCIGVVQ